MQLFFLRSENAEKGTLDAVETRHCIRVLRHQPGDIIHAIDGMGHMYEAQIVGVNKDRTELSLLNRYPNWGEHGKRLRLAVSPLRLKDRFEWLIEKAVELGVTEIIPLHCQRTDIHKAKFKLDRLKTLMLAALKQCKRSRLPTLQAVQPFNSWISSSDDGLQEEGRFVAWCEAHEDILTHQPGIKDLSSATILIGPEGDFSQEEIHLAMQHGFRPILLGNQRLRSENGCSLCAFPIQSLLGVLRST